VQQQSQNLSNISGYPKSECPSPNREIQQPKKQKYYTRKSSVTGILEQVAASEHQPHSSSNATSTGQNTMTQTKSNSGVTSR
jgi:hypothetical protein